MKQEQEIIIYTASPNLDIDQFLPSRRLPDYALRIFEESPIDCSLPTGALETENRHPIHDLDHDTRSECIVTN